MKYEWLECTNSEIDIYSGVARILYREEMTQVNLLFELFLVSNQNRQLIYLLLDVCV